MNIHFLFHFRSVYMYLRSYVTKKVAHAKKSQKCKKFLSNCIIQLKNCYWEPQAFTVFCFDPQLKWWYKLGCKCLTALLTLTEAWLKDPSYRQNKKFHKFLWSKAHWTIQNLWLQLLLAPKRSKEIGLKVSLKKMASLFTKSSLKLL